MMKKTIATVGLAAAATAGGLLLTGSPASAQTTPASARANVAYVHASAVSEHYRGDRGGYRYGRYRDYRRHGGYYGHYRPYWYRHYNGDFNRIVFRSSDINTNIAISD
jgi:hypothetical protein